MNLIEFSEQTVVYAKNQPQYRPLPAHVDGEGRVTCCWQLTLWERVKLLFTGRVWHQVLTFGNALQPQLLLTEKPNLVSVERQCGVPRKTGRFDLTREQVSRLIDHFGDGPNTIP